MTKPTLGKRVVRLFLVGLALVWSLGPIYLVVASSFKQPRRIFEVPPRLVFAPTLINYQRLLTVWPEFFEKMVNSLVVAIGATLVTIVCSWLAAYVYSRKRSLTLTGSAFFLLFVRMLPPIIITLPLFPVVNALGLNDTRLLLMLLYAAFFVSLSTWIMKAFIDQIPLELEEAAFVEGARLGQVLGRIMLPLSVHGIIAASIFVLIFSWNEFVFALIFTTSRAKTTPLVIAEILGTVEGVDWGVLFAASSVQMVPIMFFVILVQKYIIAGLTAGSVKG
jgi:multiple sugar transport system permease protein